MVSIRVPLAILVAIFTEEQQFLRALLESGAIIVE
jgi:hypothetical protein